tara:strand:- start:1707 stop:1901 length:195 start_codon:yes stop_codon:yes gene_type:complete
MEKTTIKNTETGISKECDILFKNKMRLELVVDKTTVKIILVKKSPLDEFYIGKFSNMDFISSGN